MTAPLPPRSLLSVVTFLELPQRPTLHRRAAPHERLALLRAEHCTVSFYRYLYNTVGEPWLWEMRRRMADEELRIIIQDPLVEIYVAYVAGVPAGYVELDRREAGICDIGYFGLMPEFIGKGIGPWLLDWAVEAGWNVAGTTKMTVNTCNFDHPKALATYQRVGFVPVRRLERTIIDPRLAGTLPRHAAPQIPLASEGKSE